MTVEGREITADAVASGFSGGLSARNRARSLVRLAKAEGALKLMAEMNKILEIHAAGGYADLPLESVIRSWITATQEAAHAELCTSSGASSSQCCLLIFSSR